MRASDNLVYDAISDPSKTACAGDKCQCSIVAQRFDKHGNVDEEQLFSADGDAAPSEANGDTIEPLTKAAVDYRSKLQADDPDKPFDFTCACLKVDIQNNKKIPIPVH